MSIIFTWSATNEGEGLKVIHFRNIERFRKEINDFIRSMLAPHGTIAVAMNLQSRGKDPGAANLNMVNSSL
jgi:hypothetical protein